MLDVKSLLVRPLDNNSPEPLYAQLYHRLAELIETGALKAEDRVPAERELAESLKVSRITARQALDALVKSGLVYRKQGRGTFVAEARMRSVSGFTSFTQDALSRGLRPSSVILKNELTHVDEKLQEVLKVGPEDLAIHIMRIRLTDGTPVALQSEYLPYALCPGLESEDLSSLSLYTLLREKYYINPAWTEAELQVRGATQEEAEYLQTSKNDPVMIVNGITFTETFEVVESACTVYRGKELSLYIGRQHIPSHNGRP